MKFLCDRCKTRYSIGDDRVRGKILKIRCKNCSAVITVREGMPPLEPESPPAPEVAAVPAPAASGRANTNPPPIPADAAKTAAAVAKRVITPRPASDPVPASGAPAASPALAGAFERALSSPNASPAESLTSMPPESYEVDWYVSIDGAQSGPFSLVDARAWVAAKAPGEEIYCWSDGFDDWLLVDKVSHFRDLRSRRSSVAALLPQPPAAGDPDGDDDNALDDKTAIGAPEFADGFTAPAAAAPMPARFPPLPFGSSSHRPSSVQPVAAQPVPQPASAQSGRPTGAAFSVPANTPTPQPLFARTLEQFEANAPTEVGDAPGTNGKKPSDSLIQMPPADHGAADRAKDSLELDITEASRVVRLPLQAQIALQGTAPPRQQPTNGGSAAPGLPVVEVPTAQSKIGYGSGMFGTVRRNPSGAAIAIPLDGPRPELLQPKKRFALWIPITVGAAVLIGVVSLLVYLASRHEESDGPIARAGAGSGDLARAYDSPVGRQGDKGRAEAGQTSDDRGAKVNTGKRPPERVTAGGGRAPDRRGPTEPSEVALGGGEDPVVQGYLDPNEVWTAYNRSSFQFQRCFESALKKDPFLKPPKVQVNIAVSPSGSVTSVTAPSLAGTPLGACLVASVKKWKFQKSTKGLQTSFTVAFKS